MLLHCPLFGTVRQVPCDGPLIDDGVRHGPGSAVFRAAGSTHDYSAGQARDLVLVAGHNGISYLR